jgi:hypothetical protein
MCRANDAHKSMPMDELKDGQVLDYLGEVRSEDEVVQLTMPSEYAGCFCLYDEARTPMLHHDGGFTRVAVLSREFNENVTELVCGDKIWMPDYEDGHTICYIGGDYSMHNGEWCWVDDALYCEADGDYYHQDDEGENIFWSDRNEEYRLEEDRSNNRLHEYHSGFRRDFTSRDTTYTIGFEVEKEDDDPLDTWDLDAVDETGWCRESDGSLSDYNGFELVSPIYDLNDPLLDSALEGRILRDHINADWGANCGGHINVGKRGVSGDDFFDSIQAFVPLFLTIWRHRITNHYSQIQRKPENYKRAGKYSAVNIQSRYIEFRLPPAFKNVTNLLWRRDLMRIMCANENIKPLQLITMMLNPKSALGIHLRKVYSNDQVLRVVSMYAQFADDLYGSFNFSADGVGVFHKSAVRRLKNRKVDPRTIVSYSTEAVDRLRDKFGTNYVTDAQPTLEAMDKLLEEQK